MVYIEYMQKPFDSELSRLPKNQLVVLRYLLLKPELVVTTRLIAQKTGIVEKALGGVLSAMSRRRLADVALIAPMGRDGAKGLRWKLNSKALTVALASKEVRALISSYK